MVFSEEDITKLYRIQKTLLQMLSDRNYLVEETELTMSREDFIFKYGKHMKREQLEINKTHRNNPSEKICVFFSDSDDAKLGVKIVRGFITRILQENVDSGILLHVGSKRLEVFMEDELLVNITKHECVPPHQVITEAEKRALLKKYTVKDTQLSRILTSDPVVRYYGLRPSETAGTYITYRIAS
ncbi:putative DNA-directed RNA polymerase [Medicago truncatula]|uniref:Putative DNA-directed RNA polymerase n=1 Tax=Medicago truncatula TaxID=3880 RepID=A0A396H2U5_MEDTR|nr:putative DNA-directed RNA polymerase [Medicago truncatula]